MIIRKKSLSLGVLLLLAGCAGDSQPTTQPAGPVVPQALNIVSRDQHGNVIPLFHLDVYMLSVPIGTVSRNIEFWKRVDEQQIDPPTYDLLLKNGLRVGVAPNREWAFFKQILDAHKADTRSGTASAGGSGSVSLPMKQAVGEQTIFYLSDQNKLYGRTYVKCDNLLGVSFWPEPRQPDAMRMALTPIVKAVRARLEFRRNGQEQEIVEVRPEYLYDLNLRVTIPGEHFLVLAPSEHGRWSTSLGNTFFMTDGAAEQKETVLIFAPKLTPAGE